MSQDRPKIPAPIRRAVLIEARHSCAVCGWPAIDIHHIVPWAQSQEHKFEDLIALCPNHHRQAEQGKIDRQSLREYKSKLPHSHRSFTTLPIGFHRQTILPVPPKPYVAHPYVLLEAQSLFGRTAELADLDRWFKEAGSGAKPVYVVTGIGGQGKSALTWRWFNSVTAQSPGLQSAIWWSFYESDASFDNFVTRAIAYLTGESIVEIGQRESVDRDSQLLALLRERTCLIVLDGFERLLVAYNIDQSVSGDIDISRRTAWSQRIAKFLLSLTEIDCLRVLMSTRLFPADLETVTGAPKAGLIRRDLAGLRQDDALAMWKSFDLEGDESRIVSIFQAIDYHPLVMRALASQVSCYRASPGNVDAWLDANPGFSPLNFGDSRKAMQHVLAYALRDLSERNQDLLLTVAIQYSPSQYDTLAAIHVGDGKTFATDLELDDALSELEDRGLLGWDRASNRYDAHPIVRTTVNANVNPTKTRIAYEAIESHFSSFPVQDQDVRSLDDLAPVISRYNALINLGRYDDAYAVLCTSRNETGLYRFVTGNECARLIEMMRPDGFQSLPKLNDLSAQRTVLCMLGNSYYHSGETTRAIAVGEQWRDARIRDHEESAENDVHLSFMLIQAGRLFEAEAILLKYASKPIVNPDPKISSPAVPRHYAALNESQRTQFDDARRIQMHEARRAAIERATLQVNRPIRNSCCMLASIHAMRGQSQSAADYVNNALATLTPKYTRELVDVFLHKAETELFSANYEAALESSTLAKSASIAVKAAEGQCNAAAFRARCLIAMNKLEEAGQEIEVAIELCKANEMIYSEAAILIDRGALSLCTNDVDLAIRDAQAAQVLAGRLEQKIDLALSFLLLARCEQVRDNRDKSISMAIEAFKTSILDGRPYAFEFGLSQAQKLLTELGAAAECPPIPKIARN